MGDEPGMGPQVGSVRQWSGWEVGRAVASSGLEDSIAVESNAVMVILLGLMMKYMIGYAAKEWFEGSMRCDLG